MSKKPETRECPKCGGSARLMRAGHGLAGVQHSVTPYLCTTCGTTCDLNGNLLFKSTDELKSISPLAAQANDIVEGDPKLKDMNPAAKALFKARMAEYGVQMWFDGYKNGLLTNALSEEYEKRAKAQGGDNADDS